MDRGITTLWSRSARYLLYLLLLFTPLARGSVFAWHHTVIELFSLAILCLLLLERGVKGRPRLRQTRMEWPLAALLLLCLVSFGFSRAAHESAEALRLLLSYLIIFFTTVHSLRTRDDVRELVHVLCGIGLLLTLIGFFKYAGRPLFWEYRELDYPAAFLSGVYGNHNHMAGYMEMVIPLMLALFLTRTRRGAPLILLLLLVLVCVLGHVLTLSRGGWVSLGVALAFMSLVLMLHERFRKKKLLAVIFCCCLLLVLFVLSGTDIFQRFLTLADDETVLGMGGRVIIWKGTLVMLKDFLAVGAGPGTFAAVFPRFQPAGAMARFYQAHNDYLQFLVELGLLFLPVLGWLLVALFRVWAERLRSTSRQTWGISLGAMTGIVAILVHSFVDFNLHIPANAVLFTVLAALVVGGPVRKSVADHRFHQNHGQVRKS